MMTWMLPDQNGRRILQHYDLSDKSFAASAPVSMALKIYEDDEIKFSYDSSLYTVVNSSPGLNEVDLYLKSNQDPSVNAITIRTMTSKDMPMHLSVADDYNNQENGTNPNAALYETDIVKKKISNVDYYMIKNKGSYFTQYYGLVSPYVALTLSYNSTTYGSAPSNFKAIEDMILSIEIKKTVSQF
jgi:hypothetical protein